MVTLKYENYYYITMLTLILKLRIYKKDTLHKCENQKQDLSRKMESHKRKSNTNWKI